MLFHTRLEWDDHKLSSEHLRKVGEQRRQYNPDLKDDEFELLDVIEIEDDPTIEEMPVASKTEMLEDQEMKTEDDEDEAEAAKKESEDTEEKLEGEEGIKKEKEDNEKDNKDQNDTKEEDASAKKEKDEKYNPVNVVGRELVVKTGGFVCRICSMFMKNDEEADLHCQTASHYINFTTITKLHVSITFKKFICTPSTF